MTKVSTCLTGILKEAGVRHVFGIPSIHNIGFYDALRDEPSIRHILCRHESSATHMADGYARAGEDPGVVITSTGPGAGYMIPPLLEAWWSCSPVLALTSNIAVDKIGRKTGTLHELDNQDRMFTDMTKGCYCPRSADDLSFMAREALRSVRSERPGPVYVEVPVDLWDREVSSDGKTAVTAESSPGMAGDLEKALLLLREAERPLIVAGTGALRAGIGSVIQAIAETLQAPVVTNAEGKGLISEDHPLSFGNAARRGVVRETIQSCTTALAIGTRLRNVDYSRRGVTLPHLIHADSDEIFMGRNFPAAVRLTGSLGAIAEGIRAGLQGHRPGAGAAWIHEMGRKLRDEKGSIDEERRETAFLEAIRRVLPREGSLVVDNTMLGYWAEYFYPSYREGGLVTAKGSSIIGFSFPAALGLKLAQPERPVIAVTGDGGFFYGAQELATCRRHGVGFPLVVVNDGAFGVIDFLQRLNYDRGYETSLVNPDLQAFAASFDVAAERVANPKELEGALSRALESGEMCLIELAASFRESPFVRY